MLLALSATPYPMPYPLNPEPTRLTLVGASEGLGLGFRVYALNLIAPSEGLGFRV